jgi:hypothetical protein
MATLCGFASTFSDPPRAKYSENRDFRPGAADSAAKTVRQIKGLEGKFVTRAKQWNFVTDQRISVR